MQVFNVLEKDYETLPEQAKGTYHGTDEAVKDNVRTLTLGGHTYVEGQDFRITDKGKHRTIAVCKSCGKLKLIYAKGICKACSQRRIYEQKIEGRAKTKSDKTIAREHYIMNSSFRNQWPKNMVCGLDKTKYTKDNYPYTEAEENAIVRAVENMEDVNASSALLEHYKDGVSFKMMAERDGMTKQGAHAKFARNIEIARQSAGVSTLLKY